MNITAIYHTHEQYFHLIKGDYFTATMNFYRENHNTLSDTRLAITLLKADKIPAETGITISDIFKA